MCIQIFENLSIPSQNATLSFKIRVSVLQFTLTNVTFGGLNLARSVLRCDSFNEKTSGVAGWRLMPLAGETRN